MPKFEPNGGLALFQFQHWHTSEFCQITGNKEVGLGPVEFQMTPGHLSITNIKYKVISIRICTFSLNLWGVAQVQRYFHSNVNINNADAAICDEKDFAHHWQWWKPARDNYERVQYNCYKNVTSWSWHYNSYLDLVLWKSQIWFHSSSCFVTHSSAPEFEKSCKICQWMMFCKCFT